MKLIGISYGEYQGHKFAKVICTESWERKNCFGLNAFTKRADYQYIIDNIIPVIDEVLNHEVMLYFNRYDKVIKIDLLD